MIRKGKERDLAYFAVSLFPCTTLNTPFGSPISFVILAKIDTVLVTCG